MLDTFRNVASLLLGYALMIMANGLFHTLLGVRMDIEAFNATVAGMVMSGYYVGLLLGGRMASHAISRVGHIRCFGLFASLISISALVHIIWVDPLVWGAMRITAGFCMAGLISITESWLNARTDNQHRGQVLSWYMITNYGAAGLGQFLLPLADPGQFVLFCVISILFSAALVPIMTTRASAPKPTPPTPASVAYLYRLAPTACVGALGAGLINAGFYSLAPIFSQRIGLSLNETSLFMAASVMSGVVLQWPLGRLSDRIGRRKVLGAVTFVTSLTCFGIALFGAAGGVWLYAMAVAYGGTAFTISSLSAAHANDLSKPENLVKTSGAMLIAFGVGAIAGPLLGGVVMRAFGPGALFGLNGVIAMAITGYVFLRLITLRRARAPGAFLPAPGSQFSSGLLQRRVRDQVEREAQRHGQYSGRRF